MKGTSKSYIMKRCHKNIENKISNKNIQYYLKKVGFIILVYFIKYGLSTKIKLFVT
jgi:hypothetical protein